MRIGIDLHALKDLMQGSRTYIYNVARTLLSIDKRNEYFLYVPEDFLRLGPAIFQGPNVRLRPVPNPHNRILRLTTGFLSVLKKDAIDVFHCQYIGPLFSPCPYVVTIHDIIHEVHPEFYPPVLRFMMSLSYPRSARNARKVMTDSDFSADLIEKKYGVATDKIAVIRLGVGPEFKTQNDASKKQHTMAKYGINGKFILFVGRIEPRKNIAGLIQAFAEAKKRHGIEHRLVIAGMADPLFRRHGEFIKAIGTEVGVMFANRVEQEDLPSLYSAADAFVYPSFAEGFGLPVLEAMACGTPVICSDRPALNEITGDAALLVDPDRISGIAAAIKRVVSDAALRKEMAGKGLKQAALFSWENTARDVLKVYEDAW